MPTTPNATLALDIGKVRIGIAIARADTRWPAPLTTLKNDEQFLSKLQEIIIAEGVEELVAGLPRGLDGQDTAQTAYAKQFAEHIEEKTGLPVVYQDEALTSAKAEQELRARKKVYTKEDVDALSATYILEDYLQGGIA